MTKHRTRAAALLAAGALAGGVTAATLTASAEDSGTGTSGTAVGADRGGQPGGPGGHRGGPGGPGGFGDDAAALAEALGVDEDEVSAAVKAAREALRPADGERPTRPTEAERSEREAAFAKALADALGVGEAKVTAALEEVRAARAAERRSSLADRLDEAVTGGDLTDADKASVLKAYDAGVLGGPPKN